MAKITLPDIAAKFASQAALNSRFQTIETALNDGVLWRENPEDEANEMHSTLDMNNNRIINLPAPASPSSPIRLGDLSGGGLVDYPLFFSSLVTESVVLVDGQTSVTFSEAAASGYTSFYISGSGVDRGRLLPTLDYVDYDEASRTLTLQESYPAGTVLLAAVNDVDTEVREKVYYGTVADLKADASLSLGRSVNTSGYYAIGDGGASAYVIVAGGTGTADGGSFIDLDNGLQAKGLFPKGVLNISQWGVAGSDSTADRLAVQAAVDYMTSGDTLNLDVDCTLENATGVGGTLVIQRADAVSSGTLYAIESATDSINIIISATITATSALDDLFRFTGENVQVTGSGKLVGNGTVLDTNSTDPLVQWRPTLLKFEGDGSQCTGLTFHQQSTVALYLAASSCVATRNKFTGGLVAHGSGTVLFFIESGVSAGPQVNNVITDNVFGLDALGATAYSAVFNTADGVVVANNIANGLLEHTVYNYGINTTIANNTMKDIQGTGIQSFAVSGASITGNTIVDNIGTSIGLQRGSNSIVNDNVIINSDLSGIAWRAGSSDPASTLYKNLTISNNTIEHDGTQPAIDVAIAANVDGLKVTDNMARVANAHTTYGSVRIEATAAATIGGKNLTFTGNSIYGSPKYTGYFKNWDNAKVSNNTFTDGGLTIAVLFTDMTNSSFNDNDILDTRGLPVMSRMCVASSGSGNSAVQINRNSGSGMLVDTSPIVNGPFTDGRYRGNQMEHEGSHGSFTVTAALDSVVSNATMRAYGGNEVILTPINKAAVDIQKSSQALYVVATANGTFTARTSDGTALGAATAVFAYEIVQ